MRVTGNPLLRSGRAAALAAALLLSAGCATKHDLRDLRLDLQALSERQDSILAALARQNAVTQDTLRQQTNQLFEIRGDVSRQLTRILDALTQLRELTGTNQRTIMALREEIEQLRQSGGAPAGAGGGTGEAIVGGRAPAGNSAEEMYAAAQQQLGNGQLGTAQLAFEQFIQEYPNHERAPDAHYFVADILEQQGKYREAADAFAEIPSLFPDSPKAPEAIYRIAKLDVEHLNKKAEARQLLNKILSTYKGSSAEGPARQLLRQIR